MSDKTPPIFSDRSLRIGTKIVAIYSLFIIATALVPLLFDPVSENALMPQNHYNPIYFSAAVHLLIFIATLISVLQKRFSWILTGSCIAIVILLRIFYQDIAIWVWSW